MQSPVLQKQCILIDLANMGKFTLPRVKRRYTCIHSSTPASYLSLGIAIETEMPMKSPIDLRCRSVQLSDATSFALSLFLYRRSATSRAGYSWRMPIHSACNFFSNMNSSEIEIVSNIPGCLFSPTKAYCCWYVLLNINLNGKLKTFNRLIAFKCDETGNLLQSTIILCHLARSTRVLKLFSPFNSASQLPPVAYCLPTWIGSCLLSQSQKRSILADLLE